MHLDLQGLLPDLKPEGLRFKACLAGLACCFFLYHIHLVQCV